MQNEGQMSTFYVLREFEVVPVSPIVLKPLVSMSDSNCPFYDFIESLPDKLFEPKFAYLIEHKEASANSCDPNIITEETDLDLSSERLNILDKLEATVKTFSNSKNGFNTIKMLEKGDNLTDTVEIFRCKNKEDELRTYTRTMECKVTTTEKRTNTRPSIIRPVSKCIEIESESNIGLPGYSIKYLEKYSPINEERRKKIILTIEERRSQEITLFTLSKNQAGQVSIELSSNIDLNLSEVVEMIERIYNIVINIILK